MRSYRKAKSSAEPNQRSTPTAWYVGVDLGYDHDDMADALAYAWATYKQTRLKWYQRLWIKLMTNKASDNDGRMPKYKTQIISRLKWYFNKKATPPPAWYYPTDGWITDPKEIIKLTKDGL